MRMKRVNDTIKITIVVCSKRNPTPNDHPIQVKSVDKDELNYFNIKNDGLELGQNPFSNRMKFWSGFYEKYENILKKRLTGSVLIPIVKSLL